MPHRSPIIFWLLLAATISVDAVVLSLVAAEQNLSPGYLSVLFSALIVGQLGVVCIWSAFSLTPTLWTRTAPLFAVGLAALAAGFLMQMGGPFRAWTIFTSYLGYFGLHAVSLLAALWLLQRTGYWRRRTNSVHTWQFSLFHVLTVMTLTAVLAALARNNVFLDSGIAINVAVAACSIALALISAVLWSFSWNWLLRFAGVIGFAGLLGIGIANIFTATLSSGGFHVFNIFQAYYLIQAVVLSLWLGIGPILPPPKVDAAKMQTDAPPVTS